MISINQYGVIVDLLKESSDRKSDWNGFEEYVDFRAEMEVVVVYYSTENFNYEG